MSDGYILVKQSLNLNGQINLHGAKNAALPIMASLILTQGKSTLKNIPNSSDILQMIKLLQDIGAQTHFDLQKNILEVDTSNINKFKVNSEIMSKMRASILVAGPLLARFGKAAVAMPGGCIIGARPIDFHIKGFKKMGILLKGEDSFLHAEVPKYASLTQNKRIVLEYPSVGATENIAMLATLTPGEVEIVNAALEPEVLDFIHVLKKMGAKIEIKIPATIVIQGVQKLNPIEHEIMPDRLEAGTLLLASAISGGQIQIPNARFDHMDVFLEKLIEMGHEVTANHSGVSLKATKYPKAVSFKTGPYPGFPTDLQPPMMAAQCLADGISCVEETVFENRLMHAKELTKMGAQIKIEGSKAIINGVDTLYGTEVIATDIRASCSLVLAGLSAKGQTKILGIQHWRRGYDNFEKTLSALGAQILIE